MVRHIPCGIAVNESERLACERLRAKLQAADGDWIILSNLNHAQHPSVRSDEIDAVIIGPPGVSVVEIALGPRVSAQEAAERRRRSGFERHT